MTDPVPVRHPSAGRGGVFTIFPSVVLPMFLAIVDQTIVSAALPEIAASLGQVHYISWIVVAYLVANTIAAPVYGRLGDLLGRRRLMLGALVLFGAASILCALSTSMEMLICARVLQGLGGGGLMTLSHALLGEVMQPRERARFQGYLATVAVTSNALGPVMGGYLTQHFGWRSIFLVNLPLGVLAFVMALRLKTSSGIGERRPFDVKGLLYLSVFVTATLVGFGQAQHFTGEALFLMAVLLAVAAVFLMLLLRHEGRVTYPLLPVKLLRRPTIWRCDALAACHGATFVALVTFVPIYLRVVRGTSAAEIGLLLLPLSVGVGFGSLVTGRAVSRTGRTAIFPSIGLSGASAMLAFIAIWGGRLSEFEFSMLLGLTAMFMGTVMGVVQVTVQGAASPRVLGAASATVQLSRSIGAAFGTGLVSLVLFTTIAAADAETARIFLDLIQQGPDAMAALSPSVRERLEVELGGAFVAAFLTIAAFSGIGMLLAWSIPVRRL